MELYTTGGAMVLSYYDRIVLVVTKHVVPPTAATWRIARYR